MEAQPIKAECVDRHNWTDILSTSRSEGYNMVNRLLTDYRNGTNRFDAAGEALYGCHSGGSVVAVVGLNREPDTGIPHAGRIRRLYVHPAFRGKGLGRALVEHVIRSAESHFEKITVNVGKLDIGGFYERLGFEPAKHPSITHMKELRRDSG